MQGMRLILSAAAMFAVTASVAAKGDPRPEVDGRLARRDAREQAREIRKSLVSVDAVADLSGQTLKEIRAEIREELRGGRHQARARRELAASVRDATEVAREQARRVEKELADGGRARRE